MHIYPEAFTKIFEISKKHIYPETAENVGLHIKLHFYLIKKHIYAEIKNENFEISHNAYISRGIHIPIHHCSPSGEEHTIVSMVYYCRGIQEGYRYTR